MTCNGTCPSYGGASSRPSNPFPPKTSLTVQAPPVTAWLATSQLSKLLNQTPDRRGGATGKSSAVADMEGSSRLADSKTADSKMYSKYLN